MIRLLLALLLTTTATAQQITWRFDHLPAEATTVGTPAIIDTDLGKAIQFDGHSALFFPTIPLTGATTYTWQAIFRPSSAGAPEQRFFHLQDAATQSRRLFELRIHDNQWCLDAFATTYVATEPAPRRGLILNCDAAHLHPLDRWYAIAAIYDGKVLRSYVDGVLQGESAVDLLPLGPGGVSVGTRYDKRDFFTGDLYDAVFTPKALDFKDLQTLPKTKQPH